jgi:glycosyltransferase involved in cell wall biosynthesis
MSRNELCYCGSGKRFKHCHGSGNTALPQARKEVRPEAREDALAAHRAGSLGRADALYRLALEENPKDVDSLHMLGVVLYERMRYRDALDVLWNAAEQTGWANPTVRHNLGLVLGKMLAIQGNVQQAALLEAFVAHERKRETIRTAAAPLVSVVLCASPEATHLARAIRSVAGQTYPHIELLVIEPGSTAEIHAALSACLPDVAFPTRVITHEDWSWPSAANAGAALAQGQFIAFLDADDFFAPGRIEAMVEAIAQHQERWGFSLVDSAADEHEAVAGQGIGPIDLLQMQRRARGLRPASFTLLEFKLALASGNLFIDRELFDALGGFRDLQRNYDWDLCLRASEIAEPVLVNEALYFQLRRMDQSIIDLVAPARNDPDHVFEELVERILSGNPIGDNRLAPHFRGNRALFLRTVFRAGLGEVLSIATLQGLAAEWRASSPPAAAEDPDATTLDAAAKTALVVLGMHRSGTSALSRVLNLCGAFLPEKVTPAKLGVNPKGFWEPESVVDLNNRVIRQLGGAWNRIDFALPAEGEVVDEFEADALAMLAEEYGDQAFILMKDPRICVLAPLWDDVLVAAAYRPTYVIPVRDPLEVARSLHVRGGMSVTDGLKLWLTYMQHVEQFASSHPWTVHTRYTDLLQDWRGTVARIATRLNVPLAAGQREGEVDRFLEAGLRNQKVSEDVLDILLLAEVATEIRALYASLLARCDEVPAPAAIGGKHFPAVMMSSSAAVGEATATFVLCIENNGIRDQALLLCESIRRYAGRYRDAPIIAYAPRPGLGVDTTTRSMLADMNVDYVDEPLNIECQEYGSANRVAAGAHAEKHVRSDFIVVLDSDTVWLAEPELPLDADAAVRPVDLKGSATRGPGDRYEDYWQKLADLGGTSLDRLPWMHTTIGGERIRASYNGGLIVVRRSMGILERCANIFFASAHAELRPHRGLGADIIASTGRVGRIASEYWGSNQAALALAIWGTTSRVRHYPDRYNVPLHLVAADGEMDPRWLAHSPVHLHYHWMFGARYRELGLELLERLSVSSEQRSWLAARTPLSSDDAQFPARRAVAS